jgi:hypothetical protein
VTSRNEIYLRRRAKVLLPDLETVGGRSGNSSPETLGARLAAHLRREHAAPEVGPGPVPPQFLATAAKNFETLGYVLSPALIERLGSASYDELLAFYEDVFGILREIKGAHRDAKPMYPNFPRQVMEASQVELYLNALVHYWSFGRLRPATEARARLPLLDNVELKPIDLGSEAEFESLFTQLVGGNSSISAQDKADVAWFVAAYGDDIGRLIPEAVPQKETRAVLGAALLQNTKDASRRLEGFCQTATDVLRLAVGVSGGDVSLAENTRFGLTRPQRRLILHLLDRISKPQEDMLRFKGQWKRLAHDLHSGEFRRRFPQAAAAIDEIRKDGHIERANTEIERLLAVPDAPSSAACLSRRPGELARRLDHLLRLDAPVADDVLDVFAGVAERVSTPVLLQVQAHFQARSENSPVRVFFPKGDTARAQLAPNDLPELPPELCDRVVRTCRETLVARFAELEPLGRIYLDPALHECAIPHGGRSASKSSRTAARGSRLPLPAGDTLRFFIWWRNAGHRTDLDLTASILDENFGAVADIAYYNLKDFGGHHSGDIVDAPFGASEFIDIELPKVAARGGRYVAMLVTSYTGQLFSTLPECFAGWMIRRHANSGEIYDPRTVVDKLDVTTASRMVLPLLIDVAGRQMVWCDMSIRSKVRQPNNVFNNRSALAYTLEAMLGAPKPMLFDLMAMHAEARGRLVATPEEADVSFTLAGGFPFQLEEIASKFMA